MITMSMRRNIWQLAASTMLTAAMITVASCATDDETQNGEGGYMGQPITLTASAAGYGDTVTRATVDGTFDEGMSVAVRIGSETRQYTAKNIGGTWTLQAATGVEPFYYDSPTATVKAWAWGDGAYRNAEPTDITVGESQVSESAYKACDVVMAERVVSPTDNALEFSHKTARVKVSLTKGMGITDDDLNNATVTLGIKQGDSDKNIKMYNGGSGSFLAMVAPVTGATPQLLINCGGSVFEYMLTTAQDFGANKQYAFNLNVRVSTIDLSKFPDGLTIEDDGEYTITGTGTKSVIVKGNATIKLKNANITGEGNAAISVESGNPTFVLEGETTLTGGSEYAGLYNKQGTTITIQGDGKLIAKGENAGAGIGANKNNASGKIFIKGGTIEAYGSSGWGSSAGIGCSSGSSCEGIEISGGKVRAESGHGYAHASIGEGGNPLGGGPKCPYIKMSNCWIQCYDSFINAETITPDINDKAALKAAGVTIYNGDNLYTDE